MSPGCIIAWPSHAASHHVAPRRTMSHHVACVVHPVAAPRVPLPRGIHSCGSASVPGGQGDPRNLTPGTLNHNPKP